LEIDKPHEEELSFIIPSEFPEQIINKIKNTEIIENYELKNKNKILQITDRYYDVSEKILQKNKYSLRIRIEENEEVKQKFITLKGPTKTNYAGNPVRIEIEKEWNFNEVKSILLELKRLVSQITIDLDESNYSSNPQIVLEKIGFNEIQQRKTMREEIGVVIDEKVQVEPEFAKLYLDHVIYFFNLDLQIKYYNIEIELNKNNVDPHKSTKSVLNQYSNYLSDFKHKFLLQFPWVKEWPHSKYLTGKAIKTLIDNGIFQDIVDEQGNLRPIAYRALDKLITEKKL
jgi:hypothetical protein